MPEKVAPRSRSIGGETTHWWRACGRLFLPPSKLRLELRVSQSLDAQHRVE